MCLLQFGLVHETALPDDQVRFGLAQVANVQTVSLYQLWTKLGLKPVHTWTVHSPQTKNGLIVYRQLSHIETCVPLS